MKIDNLTVTIKIKMKISLIGAIKWRLLGLHKKDIMSKSIGDVSETEIITERNGG